MQLITDVTWAYDYTVVQWLEKFNGPQCSPLQSIITILWKNWIFVTRLITDSLKRKLYKYIQRTKHLDTETIEKFPERFNAKYLAANVSSEVVGVIKTCIDCINDCLL